MPQLSPMMGIVVFGVTNVSFFIVVISIRSASSINPIKDKFTSSYSKAFRMFS